MSARGLLLSFEGTDGCGKSTQIRLLARWLEGRGHSVAVFREPGGAVIPEAIRAILLDPAHTGMAPETELLLYTASRIQLLRERVLPALEEGRVVILDRFADSTTAYQGHGRGLPLFLVERMNELVRSLAWPRRTWWLDLDPAAGLARTTGRGAPDRMEAERIEFFQAVRAGYASVQQAEPERVIKLDAEAAVTELARLIQLGPGPAA
jgi:dTMP kinase